MIHRSRFVWSLLLLLGTALLGACDNSPASVDPPVAPVALGTTAPDDYDPIAAKLARETLAHRAAGSGTHGAPVAPESAAAPGPSGAPWGPVAPPPAPPVRPASEAGVLVLALVDEDSAKVNAGELRWELGHQGGTSWTFHVDAIHIYERTWAVRVSPLLASEATALCQWLWRPKQAEESWMGKDARRQCRYTSKPVLTSKTDYTIIPEPPR